jgi:hypothetical protein
MCMLEHISESQKSALSNLRWSFKELDGDTGFAYFRDVGIDDIKWMARGFGEESEIEAVLLEDDPMLNKYERRFFVAGINDQDWTKDWEKGECIG